ncbi:F420-0--gamma-glutamyl ligase [Methanocaldococcus villosus KIN24-T80]|uniref:F420-0--gamma-glutamyl ligase n=1 Tax=Methanocaldococcus villosus KIN24-T80 TaxID=1069083 RepID=N6VZC7_9EURY|nr:coenzyme F420-0:L-glutamate ligase [Methanocaldococcus villosus]ENN96472.1 F420-0--gamma-glutamyl ligase [Methanocaldococcus villosus KIN24-T80]
MIKEKNKIEIIGLELPIFKGNDITLEKLADIISQYPIKDYDIIVIAETLISKAEGNIIERDKIIPTKEAIEIAKKINKDPKVVQVILNEAKEIVKIGKNFIITETKHGFVCANSGVDESNVLGIKTLPKDPDKSAEVIRKYIEKKTKKKIAVIISDSVGRPFRKGAIGIAIGVSGIIALWDRRGEKDLFGRELKSTEVAVADLIASAANLAMGEANEGVPVVIIRGAKVPFGNGKASDLIRNKEEDVFR